MKISDLSDPLHGPVDSTVTVTFENKTSQTYGFDGVDREKQSKIFWNIMAEYYEASFDPPNAKEHVLKVLEAIIS